MSLSEGTFLHTEETTILRKGELINANFKRPLQGGGVELWARSPEIHAFFAALPEKEPGGFHKGWKLPLFTPKTLPEVADCSFDSVSSEFQFSMPGHQVSNLTFFRARGLKEGITFPISGLVCESDLTDMIKIMKMAATELFRSYMDSFEVSMKLTYEEMKKIA